MTFLAPLFLVGGLAFAAVMVALHLITRDRPPRAPLPTARFVPGRVERAMTRALRPADPLLLAIRVLVLVLAAAAFARPVLDTGRRAVARVVLLDRSRAVADPDAARDTALALLGPDDALVLFDSAARVVTGSVRDTLTALLVEDSVRRSPRGSLSAALIAAQRAAVPLREHADSIELVIISAFASEQADAATPGIRALWPGRARLVQTALAGGTARMRPDVRGEADDPLVAAAELLDGTLPPGGARIIREPATSSDSAYARSGALIVWPRDVAALGWPERPAVDTVGAVVAGHVVLVAALDRPHRAPDRRASVVARWVDGEPAAIEYAFGDGCIREVGVPIEPTGDLALRGELRELLMVLAAPCGGWRALDRLDDSSLDMLAGDGPLADAQKLEPAHGSVTPLVPWLLGAALLLGLLEPLVRRGGRERRP